MSKLKPANANPLYVLMTLSGEQEGKEIDFFPDDVDVWNSYIRSFFPTDLWNIVKETRHFLDYEPEPWDRISAQVETDHKSAWEKRCPSQPYPGLPKSLSSVEFDRIKFIKPLVLTGFVLPRCNFVGSHFEEEANFEDAIFLNGADFRRCFFRKQVSFSGSHNYGRFTLKESFCHADFNHEDTVVSKRSDYSRLSVSGDAKFAGSHFLSPVSFIGLTTRRTIDCLAVHFDEDTSFYGSHFKGKTSFDRSVFGSDAEFGNSTFEKRAEFKECFFKDRGHFSKATFEEGANFYATHFEKRAVFSDCTFHKEAKFAVARFRDNAYFRNARFGQLEPRIPCEVTFRDADFSRPTVFLGAHFYTHAPEFEGTVLHERTSFTADAGAMSDPYWPYLPGMTPTEPRFWRTPSNQPPEKARDSFAAIRHAVAKQGLPDEEHFFFRREMHYAGKAASLAGRLPYIAFWALSEYGSSIRRPLVWLALLALFATWMLSNYDLPKCPDPIWHALSNSLSFLGFLRFYYPECAGSLPNDLKTLSGLQTALSFILLFFLGLGLRQRFRLR